VGGQPVGNIGVVAWWNRSNDHWNRERAATGEGSALADTGGFTFEFVLELLRVPSEMAPNVPPVLVPIVRTPVLVGV
jgi:hypothetical protein